MRLPLTLLLLAAPMAAVAYPIPEQSVRMLTEGAELVVVARVVEQRPLARAADDDPFANDTLAVLEVEETWKGVAPKLVEVGTNPGLACPAPARYELGRTVVAFLAKDHDGRWDTVGLSWGVMSPKTDAERAALKKEVHAAMARIEAGGFTHREEWLVAAFAEPSKRIDALHAVALGVADVPTQPRERVMAELERSFLATPEPAMLTPRVLRLFERWRSRALDGAFVKVIETVLAREAAPYWVLQSLPLLEARLAGVPVRPEDRGTVEEFELALGEKAPSDSDVRKRWKAMKKRFNLTPGR